jgi:thioredoxin-like negative regulator of GroEL
MKLAEVVRLMARRWARWLGLPSDDRRAEYRRARSSKASDDVAERLLFERQHHRRPRCVAAYDRLIRRMRRSSRRQDPARRDAE